jgi:hypothetical protein
MSSARLINRSTCGVRVLSIIVDDGSLGYGVVGLGRSIRLQGVAI